MSKSISLAGMFELLLFAFSLGRVFEFLRQDNARAFQTAPFFVRTVPLDLAFAASVLALGWFFLVKSDKTIAVSVVFIVVGVLLFSWPLLALLPTMPINVLGQWRALFLVSPTAYEFHAAVFVVGMAVAGLLRSMTGFWVGTRSETATSIA